MSLKRLPLHRVHYSAMSSPSSSSERIVVLGCGWGGFRVLDDLRVVPGRTITCVSKNNQLVIVVYGAIAV
jgi:hypothetical protein